MVSEEEIEAAIRKMIMEKNGDDLNAALEEFTEDKTDTEIHFAAEKFLELYHLGIQHKEDERRRKEDERRRKENDEKRKEEYLKKRDERWFGLYYGRMNLPRDELNHEMIRLCCLCGYSYDYVEKGTKTRRTILLPRTEVKCPICLLNPAIHTTHDSEHASSKEYAWLRANTNPDMSEKGTNGKRYNCIPCELWFSVDEYALFCYSCLAEIKAWEYGKTWILDVETGGCMTVAKLKSVLKDKGLSNKGKKAELVKRLNDFNGPSN